MERTRRTAFLSSDCGAGKDFPQSVQTSQLEETVQAKEVGREVTREASRMSDSDFDSLFVIGEADQSALVAKQQMTYQGSGYNSPSRGSPARRNQVSSQSPSDSHTSHDRPIQTFYHKQNCVNLQVQGLGSEDFTVAVKATMQV